VRSSQLKYKDKLSHGIETYKELQAIIQNQKTDSVTVTTSKEYMDKFLFALEKVSKFVSKLEKLNSELEQAEKNMHGLLVFLKATNEGLYGNQTQTNGN